MSIKPTRSLAEKTSALLEMLSDYPGRSSVMMRCLITSALVIMISMTLQIPFLALSLIAVFYVTQKNVVLSKMTAILFFSGTTLAIGLSILTLKFTYSYPMLRILLAYVLFFGSVYMMRASKAGIVFFLTSVIIIYTHTFADVTDNADLVVRLMMWLWVAINYSILLTLITNLLFIPQDPVQQFRQVMLAQNNETLQRLECLINKTPLPEAVSAEVLQGKILSLQHLLAFAVMHNRQYKRTKAFQLARLNTISTLYLAAQHLQPVADTGLLVQVREACLALQASMANDSQFVMPAGPEWQPSPGTSPVLFKMLDTLVAFSHHHDAQAPVTQPAPEKKPFQLNPTYLKFALKTALSSFICYLIYVATDWQGIHTIMLSCVIVAQSSLGTTTQRALLRVIGAVIGSLIALLMVVLVMPHIDTIVGLLLMTLPVVALGAWVYAGSEKMSYAGIQLMFTFALALLEAFGPTFELVEIRDRIIGILLGVGIATLTHVLLWPEVEGEQLWKSISRILQNASQRIKQHAGNSLVSLQLWQELANCENIAARVALEPGGAPGDDQSEYDIYTTQAVLGHVREVLYIMDSMAVEADQTADAVYAPLRERAGELLALSARAVSEPAVLAGWQSETTPADFQPQSALDRKVQHLFYEIAELLASQKKRLAEDREFDL
ncbi:FUSC family protein [Enterobacteriaceae bacterium H11S18]|uniref:FUSC family protein n=1 Tax=Dryocola clanedunensis TaxID=2925396 RepID=UPI0022F0B53F|nr:FUSC family protein [Dryocola clanedunensis]MCT4713378.1 FUSC family protein [Dryocola clanedunensis]